MRFRIRGDSRRIFKDEINKWNQMADQHARGELRKIPSVGLASYDPSSRVARVKNTSGSDRSAFECMSIDGLSYDLETTGESDVLFKLITADPAKAPAVLIEPIASGAIGRAVLDGLAIAKVGGGSGLTGTPDATNHRIAPGAGKIKLLSSPHASDVRLLPVILHASGGGETILVKAPGGGIAARSSTTVSSAVCTEFKIVSGTLTTNTNTQTVYNPWPIAIPADFYFVAVKEQVTNFWIAQSPGVVDVKWTTPNLTQSLDKSAYTTVDATELC